MTLWTLLFLAMTPKMAQPRTKYQDLIAMVLMTISGLKRLCRTVWVRISAIQILEKNVANKVEKKGESAVENRVHDTILTALDNVVIPRIEMGLKSITGSSRRGPNSVVQNPDQRNFWGNMEKTPLMTASSRTDSNINQYRNYETRNSENIEDADFAAFKSNYARQTCTHHNDYAFSGSISEGCKLELDD